MLYFVDSLYKCRSNSVPTQNTLNCPGLSDPVGHLVNPHVHNHIDHLVVHFVILHVHFWNCFQRCQKHDEPRKSVFLELTSSSAHILLLLRHSLYFDSKLNIQDARLSPRKHASVFNRRSTAKYSWARGLKYKQAPKSLICDSSTPLVSFYWKTLFTHPQVLASSSLTAER